MQWCRNPFSSNALCTEESVSISIRESDRDDHPVNTFRAHSRQPIFAVSAVEDGLEHKLLGLRVKATLGALLSNLVFTRR